MVEGYPDNLGGWGAPAMFKEAGRLLSKYFRILHPFIAAFFVPLAIIQILQVYGMAWIFSHFHPHPHPHPHPGPFPPHHHHHHPHHPFGGFHAFYTHSHEGNFGSALSPVPPPHPHPPLAPLFVGAAIVVLVWVLVSLAIASFSKAIAYIYSNDEEDPAIVKSIFKSLPKSLYHIFITVLWIILIVAVASFVLSLPFHLLMFVFKKKLNPRIIVLVNKVVVDIALLFLGFVFLLAQEIAVLEPENYGLAALKRSWSLVKTKVPAALIFFLLNFICVGILGKLLGLAVFLPVSGKLPFWTVYIFGVVVAVLYLLVSIYFLVVAIVLYFSCKVKSQDEAQYLPVNTSEDNPYTPLVVPSEN